MKSYVLVQREAESVSYIAWGLKPSLTTDLSKARRYARKASADAALRALAKRPEFSLKVEAIEE